MTKNCTSFFHFIIFFLLSFSAHNIFAKTAISTIRVDDKHYNISLNVELEPEDFILKRSINISVDHPDIKLEPWQSNSPLIDRYIASFKETKKVFEKNVNILLSAESEVPFTEIKNAHLYFSYYLGSKKQTIEEILNLSLLPNTNSKEPIFAQRLDTKETIEKKIEAIPIKKEKTTWSSQLSNLVSTTTNLWIRILLVMLLGLLMSLTPCIYPMIPITLGILQSSGSKSVRSNFLQALFYTFGIATTFAILGLIAAFTGQVFGSLMMNPIFIICISIFLAYLGFSMFGFYEMYTPRFMRKGAQANGEKKSFFSIFLFGAASGTVASPCLSPGLVLLLSIVAAISNKLLGFILLFAFGFGLGIPLLIIGTFSSSLNALPRAGIWMIEIKKFFGFMLFGMVFYFLSSIIPGKILLILMTTFMTVAGIFYFYSISKNDSSILKAIKNTIGVFCCVFAVWLGAKTYQAFFFEKQLIQDTLWYQNKEQAVSIAKEEKKKLFIDIGAEFCSICKAIDRTLLQRKKVRTALKKFINLKIDGSDNSDETFEGLRKKYEVVGFPTFLLIDPENGDLLARWGSELYDYSEADFVNELEKY